MSGTSASSISRSKFPATSAGTGRHQRNVGRDLRPARGTGRAASFHAGVCQYPAAGRAHCAQPGRALGEDNVAAHHGSLSRKLRLAAEQKLKEGKSKFWWRRHRWNWESISAPWTWWCRSVRRGRSRLRCNASGAPATGAAPSQGPLLRRHARRIVGMRRAGARHPAGRSGPADHSRCSSGYSGAADRGHLRGREQQLKE